MDTGHLYKNLLCSPARCTGGVRSLTTYSLHGLIGQFPTIRSALPLRAGRRNRPIRRRRPKPSLILLAIDANPRAECDPPARRSSCAKTQRGILRICTGSCAGCGARPTSRIDPHMPPQNVSPCVPFREIRSSVSPSVKLPTCLPTLSDGTSRLRVESRPNACAHDHRLFHNPKSGTMLGSPGLC
jgi:hypothetical protein